MDELNHKPFCLEISGDYACFTRPEMKVERVSYDIPTPSAVRAVFESIFWKPAIRWKVVKIEILNPIKWISVRRNEIGSLMSDRSDGIIIEENRQQRASLLLRDVKYRVHAILEYLPFGERNNLKPPISQENNDAPDKNNSSKDGVEIKVDNQKLYNSGETPGKYLAMFERRAKKGQCFNQPYLGTREFSCKFRLVEDSKTEQNPIMETRDLGFMFYDMDFADLSNPKPMFFRARMVNGVVLIPLFDSEEIKR